MPKKKCEISIEVATDYIDDQSEPDVGRYVFAYTITIANRGNQAAKLLSRHPGRMWSCQRKIQKEWLGRLVFVMSL